LADEPLLAIILNNIGNLALEEHDHARARVCFTESAAMNRRLERQESLANNLVDLGFVALADAFAEEAVKAFRESLAICRAELLSDLLLWAIEGLAAVALHRGTPTVAARLLAAMTRPRAELAIGADYYPIGEEMRSRTLAGARAQLSEEEFAAAWAEGEALSLEAAGEQAARL